MKDISQLNQDRWNALVQHNVVCSRPLMEIDEAQARSIISGIQHMGKITGKRVLCLASGGGQQSMAFAKLGAKVTVTDLSPAQLEKDAQASESNQLPIRILPSDMRDFSPFQQEEFDIIYQPYSINYVPSVEEVFDGVGKCLKPGGIYYLMFHNPITHGSWTNGSWGKDWQPEDLWRGHAYPIRHPYEEGLPIQYESPNWHFYDQEGNEQSVPAPQEFKHTFSTILQGLLGRGLQLVDFRECPLPSAEDEEAQKIGTWEHYQRHAVPWFEIWVQKKC